MDKIIAELKEQQEPLHENCQKDVTIKVQKKGSHTKEDHTYHHVCSKANLEDNVCIAYAFPSKKWKNGDCVLADSPLKAPIEIKEEKVRVGQQKQKR